jgi:methylmalonyl-CoA/ethylmalonyl-CoA epimerase
MLMPARSVVSSMQISITYTMNFCVFRDNGPSSFRPLFYVYCNGKPQGGQGKMPDAKRTDPRLDRGADKEKQKSRIFCRNGE